MILWSAVAACADLAGGPINGFVISKEAKAPIPRAVVVALWHGSRGGPVQSSTVWYHVETAVTDEHGAFAIPAWNVRNVGRPMSQLRNSKVEMWAFAEGYEVAPRFPEIQDTLVLARFSGTREQRIEYLAREASVHGGEYDNSIRNLIPFRLAVLNEARAIASTPNEKHTALQIEWDLNALCQIPPGQRIADDGDKSPLSDIQQPWPPPPCTENQLKER
jgi:hypothetical protein